MRTAQKRTRTFELFCAVMCVAACFCSDGSVRLWLQSRHGSTQQDVMKPTSNDIDESNPPQTPNPPCFASPSPFLVLDSLRATPFVSFLLSPRDRCAIRCNGEYGQPNSHPKKGSTSFTITRGKDRKGKERKTTPFWSNTQHIVCCTFGEYWSNRSGN